MNNVAKVRFEVSIERIGQGLLECSIINERDNKEVVKIVDLCRQNQDKLQEYADMFKEGFEQGFKFGKLA